MQSIRSHPVLLGTSFRSAMSGASEVGSLDGGGELESPLLEGASSTPAAAAGEPSPSPATTGYRTALPGGGDPSPQPSLGGRRGSGASVHSRGPSRLGLPATPPLGLPLHVVESSPSMSKGAGLAVAVVILAKTIMGAGE